MQHQTPSVISRGGKAINWALLGIRALHAASSERVVLNAALVFLQDFLLAAAELVPDGAEPITADCGFLLLFQRGLTADVREPASTSSPLREPWVQATLPSGKQVGFITMSVQSLTTRHLHAAGVAPDTPFIGTADGCGLFRVLILVEKQDLANDALIAGGRQWVECDADIGAMVLTCINVPPHASTLREASGLPVYDASFLIPSRHAGLRPGESGRQSHLFRPPHLSAATRVSGSNLHSLGHVAGFPACS